MAELGKSFYWTTLTCSILMAGWRIALLPGGLLGGSELTVLNGRGSLRQRSLYTSEKNTFRVERGCVVHTRTNIMYPGESSERSLPELRYTDHLKDDTNAFFRGRRSNCLTHSENNRFNRLLEVIQTANVNELFRLTMHYFLNIMRNLSIFHQFVEIVILS